MRASAHFRSSRSLIPPQSSSRASTGSTISFAELQEMVESSRYRAWQHALSEAQGVYLITDEATGQQYVGKADGSERLLGRWRRYARTGHGDNVGLRRRRCRGALQAGAHVADLRSEWELADGDVTHRRRVEEAPLRLQPLMEGQPPT